MTSISSLKARNILKGSGLKSVTRADISKLFDISKQNTLYKLMVRLEKYGILSRVAKGKYIFPENIKNDFEIANIIMTPSYVSLESALSYYGILSQFPYIITSITPLRSSKTDYRGKEFEFTHVSESLFWGFEKKDGFLMASPEKALIDTLYLAGKGLRKINTDELTLSSLNRGKINRLAKQINFMPFQKRIQELEKLL
ncbi:MAG: hypothetical protein Q8P91_03020 [bacterium]|nr:hypothetical protein [bacterium]